MNAWQSMCEIAESRWGVNIFRLSETNKIMVVYSYINTDDTGTMNWFQGALQGDHILEVEDLTRKNVFSAIRSWVYDYSWWQDRGKRLVLHNEKINRINLKRRILKMGFTNAEIYNDDTNFVTVILSYCYYDKNGKFCYDGRLEFSHMGSKIRTLAYLQDWIKNNSSFVVSKNRLD